MCQTNPEMRTRHHARAFLIPFHQMQRARLKIIPNAHVFQLLRITQTVKIPVINVHPFRYIRLHQRVGGAFDSSLRQHRLDHATTKKALARTQIPLKGNHDRLRLRLCQQPVHEPCRKPRRFPLPFTPNGRIKVKMLTMHDSAPLKQAIRDEARRLGFAHMGVTDTDLSAYEADYFNWLGHHYHGEMAYMARHGVKRTRPNLLVPGTMRILSLRMPYYSRDAADPVAQLRRPEHAYIARYALNRDYHKLIRNRLKKLVAFIERRAPGFNYRIFTDSAPVLERPIAEKAGLGFIGKNSLLIHPRAGSWFFLAEIFTDLALPVDPPFEKSGCGPCTACMVECPTGAIVSEGIVDARRCISYLTIEHPGDIPEPLRPLMGNRIYGCDDCQLVCPWNRFGECSNEPDWRPRHHLDEASLLALWQWDEKTFLKNLEGSPVRRIGFERWRRNLAVALGNAPCSEEIVKNLSQAIENASEMVKRHIKWAISRQTARRQKSDPQNFRGTPFPARVRKAHLPKACRK